MESKINKMLSQKKFNDGDINELDKEIKEEAEKEKNKELEKLEIEIKEEEKKQGSVKGYVYAYYIDTLLAYYNKSEGGKKKYPENVSKEKGQLTIENAEGESIEVTVTDQGEMVVSDGRNAQEVTNLEIAAAIALFGMSEGASKEEIRKIINGEKKINGLSSLNKNKIKGIVREKWSGIKDGGIIRIAKKLGIKIFKTWVTMEDEKVRATHDLLDGKKKEVQEPFNVGGNEALYPRDSELPIGEKINCRCLITYSRE